MQGPTTPPPKASAARSEDSLHWHGPGLHSGTATVLHCPACLLFTSKLLVPPTVLLSTVILSLTVRESGRVGAHAPCDVKPLAWRHPLCVPLAAASQVMHPACQLCVFDHLQCDHLNHAYSNSCCHQRGGSGGDALCQLRGPAPNLPPSVIQPMGMTTLMMSRRTRKKIT